MLKYERQLKEKGYNLIAGIDEVGRGPLAGSVMACSVILPEGLEIEGVNDSKKLTPKRREKLYDEIMDKAIGVGIGEVGPEIIDQINIKKATKLAMLKSIENIKNKLGEKLIPDFLLIDSEIIDTDIDNLSIVKGDQESASIACASIIAKVTRDRKCIKWDEEYPGYNIKKHKGYGTKEHRENIIKLGPSPIHRKSFLKNILKDD